VLDDTRVLVVGDPDPGLSALRKAGAKSPELRVFGPAPSSHIDSALAGASPHVVLVRAHGVALSHILDRLAATDRGIRVLVQSELGSGAVLQVALPQGACGVIPHGLSTAALREAILRARAGELVIEAADLSQIVRGIEEAGPQAGALGRSLTAREREVLRALATGLTAREVGEVLGITTATVQSHVKNVLAKFDVHSKVDAVRLAWREGLLPLPA
jgi:DNA-binding NarL/FixJ family response regulator